MSKAIELPKDLMEKIDEIDMKNSCIIKEFRKKSNDEDHNRYKSLFNPFDIQDAIINQIDMLYKNQYVDFAKKENPTDEELDFMSKLDQLLNSMRKASEFMRKFIETQDQCLTLISELNKTVR